MTPETDTGLCLIQPDGQPRDAALYAPEGKGDEAVVYVTCSPGGLRMRGDRHFEPTPLGVVRREVRRTEGT